MLTCGCTIRLTQVAGENYETLTADLEASGVTCFITAVTEPRLCQAGIKVGAEYGRALAAAATQMSADAFGEKGEFHTLAAVWEVTRERALGTAAV